MVSCGTPSVFTNPNIYCITDGTLPQKKQSNVRETSDWLARPRPIRKFSVLVASQAPGLGRVGTLLGFIPRLLVYLVLFL